MSNMKAMAFTAHGGSDVIEQVDVELPEIKPYEVKIDVKAFALNYLDIWVRKGRPNSTMQFPHVSGSDFAGIVNTIGSKAKGFEIGDRVTVNPGVSCMMCKYCRAGEQSQCEKFSILGSGSWGGSAEQALVPANNLMKIPDTMNFTDAAAAPLTTITVYRMMRTKANLLEGENLLVLGAGGGIGTVAVKMGKHFGANVIALTSTDKVEKVKGIGADYVLDYQNTNEWDKLVLDHTDGEGANVVIDPVGASTWEKSINALANGGRHIVCGATTGPNANTEIRTLFVKQGKLEGSYMGNNREFVQSMNLVKSGHISPVIDSVAPMADLAKSHERLESGNHFGKLVLTI
ncbi:MAG: zinc-binding dehydrogenase [Candidatus Heimdallarchaeota archaeon]|nr:zinc-binding dehydrogenase [Candidatus Heimdallarchaeota archaeon]